MIKDIKLFMRETTLWLQFFIFFGILFFYFLNLRRFSYHQMGLLWKNLLTFLNMFSILCIVAGMGVRFIFPQWSLEGRNFWILKLAPVKLVKIFWEKFIFSFAVLFCITMVLIALSNCMLNITGQLRTLVFFVITASTFVVVSLSLGLGAYFADFRQEYYLKAVESLGGFITLVVNFTYIFLTVVLFAFLSHLSLQKVFTHSLKILHLAAIPWFFVSMGIAFSAVYIGFRKLSSKEY